MITYYTFTGSCPSPLASEGTQMPGNSLMIILWLNGGPVVFQEASGNQKTVLAAKLFLRRDTWDPFRDAGHGRPIIVLLSSGSPRRQVALWVVSISRKLQSRLISYRENPSASAGTSAPPELFGWLPIRFDRQLADGRFVSVLPTISATCMYLMPSYVAFLTGSTLMGVVI